MGVSWCGRGRRGSTQRKLRVQYVRSAFHLPFINFCLDFRHGGTCMYNVHHASTTQISTARDKDPDLSQNKQCSQRKKKLKKDKHDENSGRTLQIKRKQTNVLHRQQVEIVLKHTLHYQKIVSNILFSIHLIKSRSLFALKFTIM